MRSGNIARELSSGHVERNRIARKFEIGEGKMICAVGCAGGRRERRRELHVIERRRASAAHGIDQNELNALGSRVSTPNRNVLVSAK
jgi:hypothetical protein